MPDTLFHFFITSKQGFLQSLLMDFWGDFLETQTTLRRHLQDYRDWSRKLVETNFVYH